MKKNFISFKHFVDSFCNSFFCKKKVLFCFFWNHHDFVEWGTFVQMYNLRTGMNSCARWVRTGSSRQFPFSHPSSAVFHPSSPWREQSHEPLMIGFLFTSAQPRLQLMNKSNEWHVIIEQGMRDEQRVGASGRKPDIICLENLRNEQESLCFDFSLLYAAQRCCTCCTGWRESDHFVWVPYSKKDLSFFKICLLFYL